jgi:hypothetical protein
MSDRARVRKRKRPEKPWAYPARPITSANAIRGFRSRIESKQRPVTEASDSAAMRSHAVTIRAGQPNVSNQPQAERERKHNAR